MTAPLAALAACAGIAAFAVCGTERAGAWRPLQATLHAQAAPSGGPLPVPLQNMLDTEREFAARAMEIGWKEAFLEYFDNSAIGFEGGAVGLAREQLRARPDPPPGMQLLWEPRYGDIAASGELGYLTGPSQTIRPDRNKGQPQHGVYLSIWKRQRGGRFRVVMDVGIPTPRAASFAPGFTRAPSSNRFRGDYDADTPTLDGTDRVLNVALASGQSNGYRDRLAEGARLHQPNLMPAIGERAILARLASQPSITAIDTRQTQSAQSGDLGYSWGTYIAGRGAKREEGFYVRIWVRERAGQWKVAAEVRQPQ